ncbi:MAG: hypothetical protein RLZZ630_181 [Bacteroidota bacterium]
MILNTSVFFRLVLLQFILLPGWSSAQTIELVNWSFHRAGEEKVRKAVVPGCVHLDLIREGIIPDPFLNDNESRVQWVGESDWVYSTRFNCTDEVLRNKSLLLVFEGLDTYAEVRLNDSLVLLADNMFRTWKVPVQGLLKTQNTLSVMFKAPERIAKEAASKLSYTLPEGLRSFTRKAQYHYGWDWGPRLITCGIWKPVRIEANSPPRLVSMRIRTVNVSEDSITAEAIIRIRATDSTAVNITLRRWAASGDVLAFQAVALKVGEYDYSVPFSMKDVPLWNPVGRGEQHLEGFTCNLSGLIGQSVSCTTGFRNAELIREKDSIGTSFGFSVNGRPVFARGANIIPPDVFLSRVPDSSYERLVIRAKEANMNMLRVWGGGVYLPDAFYDACDRHGIMVWQDFMSACSMVPGDVHFRDNFRQEAIEQVERLSFHPSVVLWCGNNENDEGWHNWGWQKQFKYSTADSATIWRDYKSLFHEILPSVIDSLDPGKPYWPSSPSKGWGRKESLTEGDCHYWGVWWGMEPFEIYRTKTGRFMSEYGFQSVPAQSCWKGSIDTLSLTATGFRNHQKHPRGFQTIDHYLQSYFGISSSFDDYSYLSQLQQAYGMKIALEAHRGAYPRCRGTLFWQLNDCWPSVSWSALDNTLGKKLVYHTAGELFAPLFIGMRQHAGRLKVTIHNDTGAEGSYTVRLMAINVRDTAGPYQLDEKRIRLRPDEIADDAVSFPLSMLQNADTSTTIYIAEAEDNFSFKRLVRNTFHTAMPRNLSLRKAELRLRVVAPDEVEVSTNVFAYGVDLYTEGAIADFSENGFHLLPGESRRVKVSGIPAAKVRVRCYNNIKRK